MKRKLLAIAIPALLVAAGANASIEVWNKDGNKVDFYGRVKAANNITDRGQRDEGDDTSARFGMSGQTQLTDGITGYGRWEFESETGKDSSRETRYAFAGLNFGDLGSFDYGRNDGVLKAITAYTDVLPQFGGDASNNDWNVLSSRTKAVATYRNTGFFGLADDISFALQYADNGDSSTAAKDTKSGSSKEAFGAIAEWNVFDTGLTVGGGYAQTAGKSKAKTTDTRLGDDYDDDDDDDVDVDVDIDTNTNSTKAFSNAKKVKTWTSGIKYDNYNIYLAANYFESKFKSQHKKGKDAKIKGFELVAQYGLDLEIGRITPSVAYVQHKQSGIKNYLEDGTTKQGRKLVKYVSVGANYELNKNFSTFVEYKFNLLDKKDVGAKTNTRHAESGRHPYKPGTKDVLGVGMIYQF